MTNSQSPTLIRENCCRLPAAWARPRHHLSEVRARQGASVATDGFGALGVTCLRTTDVGAVQ